jgi:selenide,water dikinase
LLNPVIRRRDLLLLGGGHAHALALRMLAMRPVEGLRITLVSPASHTPYSGMLPGLIAGHYRFEDTHIDLARLCQWADVRFVTAEATGVDALRRRVHLAGRPPLGYDLLSIDIGSQPELDSVPGARAFAIPVKPVAQLWSRWLALASELADGRPRRIAVVGGGAGSVELVLAMAHRLRDAPVTLYLVCGTPELLPGYRPATRRAVARALAQAGVTAYCGARVSTVERDRIELDDGRELAQDALFWCTAAAPVPWLQESGLATDARGFLAVDDTLRVEGEAAIFAAGDVATQTRHPRPKAGVYAVRQAPVLAHNLRAQLLGRPLRQHRPQRRFLSLLSLGERRAVADRGLLTATGAWVWRWKDRIDRRFMARFSDLPEAMSTATPERLPEAPPRAQAFCGGCGAKVGGSALGNALARLRRDYPEHCPAEADDAVAMPLPASGRQVQSLDLLRGLVEDPWLMGRLAALHALSDLHACGARPLSALAALTLPFASPDLQERELEQLLAGALHEFAAADCKLLGGHSLQGHELALGFAVQGEPMAADGHLLPKRGLVAGDRLILCKPLGTGTLFAAHMQARADGRDIAAALESMLFSNAPAARLAVAAGVSAATDITGFGVAGHLREMLLPGQSASLDLAALPVLPGALHCLENGILSTAQADNEALAKLPPGADSTRRQLLCDPQTCGGLLLGAPQAIADDLLKQLQDAGYRQAAVIGEVCSDQENTGDGDARLRLRAEVDDRWETEAGRQARGRA